MGAYEFGSSPQDCNGNGIPDACDIVDEESTDFNQNGIPDECEPDCQPNDIPDFIEIGLGLSPDCNENNIPDECDFTRTTRVAVSFHVISFGLPPQSWGQVLVFDLDPETQSLSEVAEIPKEQVSDPFGVAFDRKGELFVGNRHGEPAGDGSISRFHRDDLGGYEPGAVIVANGLESVHQLAFGPGGELFAVNLTGSVSRFLFDEEGNTAANGTISVTDFLLSVAVSEQNEVFAANASPTVYRFVIDEDSGEAIAAGSFEIPVPEAHFLTHTAFDDNGDLYIPEIVNGLILRCAFAQNGTPTCTDILSIEEPVAVALADGDLFVSSRTGISHFVANGNGGFMLHDFVDTSALIPSLGGIAILSASEDCDSDNVPDECESNSDNDDIIDACDNCIEVSNPTQADFDGEGDACDPDIDNDGVLNAEDVCGFTPLGAAVDSEGRSLGDIDKDCDTDLDDFKLFQAGFTGTTASVP